MSEVTTVIPVASLPDFVRLGWRVLNPIWDIGMRGNGTHARIQWSGEGRVPYPEGWQP